MMSHHTCHDKAAQDCRRELVGFGVFGFLAGLLAGVLGTVFVIGSQYLCR